MNLTIYYIHATIAREFSTPTFPNPPDRPRLLFLRFLNFHLPPLWAFKKNQAPYLQSLAASLGLYKNTSPLFAITCRLFFQNMGVGSYAKSSLCNQQLPDSFFPASRIFPEFLLFVGPPGNRPHRVRSPQKECKEAQRKHRMAQRDSEVLPERSMGSGVVRRKKQRQHEDESANTRWPHQHAQNERDPNRQLAVRHQEGNRRRVRQHELPQHRFHEGICPSLEEFVDPVLESAAQREFRPENLVLPKNEEKDSNADANQSQRLRISVRRRRALRHETSSFEPRDSTANCPGQGAKKNSAVEGVRWLV